MTRIRIPMTAAAAVLALGLAGCAADAPTASSPVASDPATTATAAAPEVPTAASPEAPEPTAAADPTVAAEPGAWVDLAAYAADPARFHGAGDVVLFFNADWCPTCRQTVASLDAEGVPAGLTVVSVDFDDSAPLRKQHGVTVQHTFVQVDQAGEQVAKFTGSLTGEQIAAGTV